MREPKLKVHNDGEAQGRLVRIEKPIYGGSFLARDEGKAVFVPLALPGEHARVRIVDEKRGYATAEIDEIVSAAPERTVPDCRHFGACGGCQYQHTDYVTQLRLKREILHETLERAGVQAPLELDVLAGKPWEYRNRIRLAFDPSGRVGYRGRRSHEVVAIEECPIAAPLLVSAALATAEVLRDFKATVRPSELALFCSGDESALLASVFVKAPQKGGFNDFANALSERIPALRGMELVLESRQGRHASRLALWGETAIAYPAGGFGYRVGQGAFFQVNRWLVDALLERVTAPYKGRLAWDLFAGVGLFARRLASSFERVVAVESAAAATRALADNLSGMRGTCVAEETLKFLRSRSRDGQPDLIVVDPPRAGLGEATTSLIADTNTSALVYVSCDPATLARDLRTLIGAGYKLESMTLADLFPQTFHLETVVHLRRS